MDENQKAIGQITAGVSGGLASFTPAISDSRRSRRPRWRNPPARGKPYSMQKAWTETDKLSQTLNTLLFSFVQK